MKYNYIYKLTMIDDGKVVYGVHETDHMDDGYPERKLSKAFKEIVAMFSTIEECNSFYDYCNNKGLFDGSMQLDKLLSSYNKSINIEKKEEKKEKVAKTRVPKPKKVSLRYVNDPEYVEKIRQAIENGIDLSKHGWTKNMIEKTGINKGTIHRLMKTHFPDIYANAYHHVEKFKQVWIIKDGIPKRISEGNLATYEKDGWKLKKAQS